MNGRDLFLRTVAITATLLAFATYRNDQSMAFYFGQLQGTSNKNRTEQSNVRHLSFPSSVPTQSGSVGNNSNMQDISKNCSPLPMQEYTASKPILVPSYPGSGSEMFRLLVEAVTGLKAAKWLKHCKHGQVVSCKFHAPLLGSQIPANKFHLFNEVAFVLVRNPTKAFASRFNVRWERSNHVKGHSQVGPETAWRDYRDRHFQDEVNDWTRFLREWNSHPNYKVMHISYEALVDDVTGPAVTAQVVKEFAKANASSFAHAQDVPCLWRLVVKEKPEKKRKGHTYVPGFTAQQKRDLLLGLDTLQHEFSDRADLVSLLTQYREDISTNVPTDDEVASAAV